MIKLMEPADLIEQIDTLIREYGNLRSQARHEDLSDLKLESRTLVVRLQAGVDRLAQPSSAYAREAAAAMRAPPHVRIPILVGVLQSLRSDVEHGWYTTVTELLHADTFSDFLDMSSELLDKGYKDAAAVISGAVLEQHLRLLCAKHGLPGVGKSGQPEKADATNTRLRDAGVYPLNKQKQVTAWLGIRNSSAHGAYGDYAPEDVRLMVAGIRQFISDLPA